MGRLIVIEGLDGSGKSTQLSLLSQRLTAEQINFKEISFPDYADPSSTLVKMYLAGDFGNNACDVGAYAASTFYAADRYASFKRHWGADYLSGKTIISGRYTTSNAIHQMTKLPVEQWDSYLQWIDDYEYVKLGIPKPDLVLFLDMPTEISQKLLSKRYCGDENQKDIHERDLDYLNSCQKAAKYAAEKQNWKIISCGENNSPKTPEHIATEIYKIVADIIIAK